MRRGAGRSTRSTRGADELRQDARADRPRGGDGGRARARHRRARVIAPGLGRAARVRRRGPRRRADRGPAGNRDRACPNRRAPCAPSPPTTTPRSCPKRWRPSPPPTTATPTSYGADEWTDRLRDRSRELFGDGRVDLPGVQRHGRERRRAARDAAAVAGRDLRRERAPERRRGRRARGDGRDQAADRADARRQAHAGAGRTRGSCGSATSTSCSPASCRSRSRPSSGRCTRSRSCARSRDHAHAHGMLFHIDGSRLANAAASLDVLAAARSADAAPTSSRSAARRSGCSPARRSSCSTRSSRRRCCTCASSRCSWRRRCGSSPPSCSRCFEGDLWRRAAGHANAMAARLADGRARCASRSRRRCRRTRVFAILPPGAAEELQREFKFYVWDEHTGEVRWMCSWDTTEEDVDAFVAAIGVVRRRGECRRRTPRAMRRRSA